MKDETDELRKAILKKGTVKKSKITISQNFNSNGTVSPIKSSNQEIVEIGVDDLMHLITTHTLRARRGFADQLKLAMIDGKASHSVSRINEIIDQELAAAENFDHLKSQRKGGKS